MALLATAAPLHAQGVTDAGAIDTGAIDYGEALRLQRARSGTLQGADLDAQAKRLQAAALGGIARPDLRLTGFAGRVSTTLNIDTSGAAAALNPVLDQLAPLAGLALPSLPPLPPLPSSFEASRVFNVRSLGLGSVWPLYTGGRLPAVQAVAEGRADEAQAALRTAREDASVELAQRYFGVQLARKAWHLRQAAVTLAQQHQQDAMKLERAGLLAKVERLKADVAVDQARREAAKAGSDLELASLALQRQLPGAGRGALVPSTPLFVHAQAVASLASFVDAALRSNGAWQTIASKRKQAAAAVALQGSQFSPTVIGLANLNLDRGGAARANWLVGVAVSVPLVERIDRASLAGAARLEQQRVEVLAEQAGRDIPTLAESQWRAMEDARQRYLSLASTIALAAETRRLAQVSFVNAQATSTEVADATLNATKVSLERAQAAYDYVLALARLLATTGQSEQLAVYARSAPHLVDLTKD